MFQNPDQAYHLLVCGLPNVGKSSLINAFRRTYLRKGIILCSISKNLLDLMIILIIIINNANRTNRNAKVALIRSA